MKIDFFSYSEVFERYQPFQIRMRLFFGTKRGWGMNKITFKLSAKGNSKSKDNLDSKLSVAKLLQTLGLWLLQ